MILMGLSKSGERIPITEKNRGNTHLGALAELKEGRATTNKGHELTLVSPQFYDYYTTMKRGPQPISLKDCGLILAETLLGKDSVVFDCGTGMGGLACFLGRYVKKVYSMDNRDEHLSIGKDNATYLKLKNVEFIKGDIYEGIPVKRKFDAIILDVTEPEKAIPVCADKIKLGGFVVAYCPQVTQVIRAVEELSKGSYYIQTIKESIIRPWEVRGQVCRPEHMALVHTGFIIVARRI